MNRVVAEEGSLRREYSVKAGKNMVQADLVREITSASGAGRSRKVKMAKQ